MLEVMRDILQSRYMRSNVAHKQLARTSLRTSNPLWCVATWLQNYQKRCGQQAQSDWPYFVSTRILNLDNRFSRDVIAAMFVDETKRSLIRFFCSKGG